MKKIKLALTYDDVLIVPKRSTLFSRSEASTRTKLTNKISLNIPIISANMDTVTESEMAIAMAHLGGVGAIHRFMTIEDNVEEIKRVKRAQNYIIEDPYSIGPDCTVKEAKNFAEEKGVNSLLVVSAKNKLLGIVTRRDVIFAPDTALVENVMTPRKEIIAGGKNTTLEKARLMMVTNKIEKLPLVNREDEPVGLITLSDIEKLNNFPQSSLDSRGRLIVLGSIGVHGDYLERLQEMVKAGVDAVVIDIAHGHSDMMFRAIKKAREACSSVELIAGNVATGRATRELCEIGVDAIKVGVGPGTTCITRLVTGCGVPQLTAVMESSLVAKKYGVPVIADGGIQKSGDIVKAIGAGADSVMLGGLLAGTKESPGIIMNRNGEKHKVCRGSASFAVAQRRVMVEQEKKALGDIVPEGVESVVPYKGMVSEIISQLVGGLRSGMSYTNSRKIGELKSNVEFVQITSAGQRESGPHDLYNVK